MKKELIKKYSYKCNKCGEGFAKNKTWLHKNCNGVLEIEVYEGII